MKLKKITAILMALAMSAGIASFSQTESFEYLDTYAISQEQSDFIENIGYAAQANYSQYQILPSMTIAQAILESGWGTSSLSQLYYNFFGMKAGGSYSGETVSLYTGEEIDGVTIMVDGTFRAYHSFDEGIRGYYEFISGYSRYSNLIGETDYVQACIKIKEDGWATDSSYSQQLINIIESYDLTRFDYVLPESEPENTENDSPALNADTITVYYPSCSSDHLSIVDALLSVGEDSSFETRMKIAEINGISNYSSTAEQNIDMLSRLKEGTLIKDFAPVSDDISLIQAGDVNLDGVIDASDIVLISAYTGNRQKNPIDKNGLLNGDVHNTGDGLTINDALAIQQYLANTAEIAS